MAMPEQSPADEVVSLKLEGTAHLKDGRIIEARDAYTRALAADPDRKHAEASIILANRALTNLKLSENDACQADCTAALKINPGYGKAYFRRAQAYEAKNDLSKAFTDVRELMRLEPTNKEAQALAGKLKRSIEARASTSDLSTPTLAVETLRKPSVTTDEQVQAVGKLSRIAEDESRAKELLHAGAVAELLKLLPKAGAVTTAAALPMPLVGLAIEALDRMALSTNPEVLVEIAGKEAAASAAALAEAEAEGPFVDITDMLPPESTADRVLSVVKLASGARDELGDGGDSAADGIKNLLTTARRGMSLLATLAGCRSAVGSVAAQGDLVRALLPFLRHTDDGISKCGQDCLVRVVSADLGAAGSVLHEVLRTLIWLLGDEESAGHRVALGVLMKLMGKQEKPKENAPLGEEKDKSQVPLEMLKKLRARLEGTDKEAKKKKQAEEDEEQARVEALCGVCEMVLSPILRSDDASWEEHVAAVHGVTAVLEVNKEVGAWLLRQESIFWSLAECAEMDDEDLSKSLAEVYAHAANDQQHFREKAGDEPIKHLKGMLKSTKPRVRCRACVALAKVCLLHPAHRVDINPNGRLLTATLGLLEAKVPPSVHRWAVEAFMFLTMMPDTKNHLAEKGIALGSMVSLADSATHDHSLHFSLIQVCNLVAAPMHSAAFSHLLSPPLASSRLLSPSLASSSRLLSPSLASSSRLLLSPPRAFSRLFSPLLAFAHLLSPSHLLTRASPALAPPPGLPPPVRRPR